MPVSLLAWAGGSFMVALIGYRVLDADGVAIEMVRVGRLPFTTGLGRGSWCAVSAPNAGRPGVKFASHVPFQVWRSAGRVAQVNRTSFRIIFQRMRARVHKACGLRSWRRVHVRVPVRQVQVRVPVRQVQVRVQAARRRRLTVRALQRRRMRAQAARSTWMRLQSRCCGWGGCQSPLGWSAAGGVRWPTRWTWP